MIVTTSIVTTIITGIIIVTVIIITWNIPQGVAKLRICAGICHCRTSRVSGFVVYRRFGVFSTVLVTPDITFPGQVYLFAARMNTSCTLFIALCRKSIVLVRVLCCTGSFWQSCRVYGAEIRKLGHAIP